MREVEIKPKEKPRSALGCLKRLLSYFAPWRGQLGALLLVCVLAILLDIAVPVLMEGCVDALGIAGRTDPVRDRFFFFFALFLGDVILSAILGYLHDILSAKVGLYTSAKLKEDLFGRILLIPTYAQKQQLSGDLMSRIVSDCDLAAKSLSEVLPMLISSLLAIIGSSFLMLKRSSFLGLLCILSTLFSLFVMGAISRGLLPRVMERQKALGKLSAHIEESFRYQRTCLAGGRREENRRRLEAEAENFYHKSVGTLLLESAMEPLMLLFGNLNLVLILIFGSRQVLLGRMGLGTLQAFILLSRQFMEPVRELSPGLARFWSALSGAERVFEILDEAVEPSQEKLPGDVAASEEGSILSFKDVSFAYRRKRPVLQGLNLQVSSGEHVALVGESGVGKTTLMSLLTRLYSSYQGAIYLNGKEIRTLPLEELRRKVGVVSQEPELINGTIWENICYGCEGATREDARRIAILLGLDAMVLECKEGYDTILDSKAPPFSQGQLQMLSLSRMVLRGPEVLILDESTSSIDTETESLLQKAIYQAMEGRTCLFIAHRLTSIKQMDRICVMERGVITEEGTHEELLKRGGSYAAAYALRRQGEASLT